ncbi:hypothetical protein HK405_013525, partial [Cladochytrium tenue]
MERAEDALVDSVEAAMRAMAAVGESTEPLDGLAALVHAQLAYFQEARDALAEIEPDVADLCRANE